MLACRTPERGIKVLLNFHRCFYISTEKRFLPIYSHIYYFIIIFYFYISENYLYFMDLLDYLYTHAYCIYYIYKLFLDVFSVWSNAICKVFKKCHQSTSLVASLLK